jgi:DNA polymerase-3 subunit epsilon
MTWPRSPDRRRSRQLAGAPEGPLRDYLAQPFPGRSVPHTDLRLLAVDLETTGLDPARDEILSIGLVPVDGERIVLSGARQMVVRGDGVGQSAAIHGLTDDAVARGIALPEALAVVLPALAGRVLLAHHAPIETGFLDRACRRVYGRPLPCVSIDTMVLEHRLVGRGWGQEPEPGGLRLAAARQRHGLPRYRSHEALTDALACAELYLAQASALARGHPLTLRQLT